MLFKHPASPLLAAALTFGAIGCAARTAPTTTTPVRTAASPQDTTRGGAGGAPQAPRPYRQVITDRAVTQSGLFKVHRIGERLLFELPTTQLDKEMLLVSRPISSTLQDPGR